MHLANLNVNPETFSNVSWFYLSGYVKSTFTSSYIIECNIDYCYVYENTN